VIKLFIQGEFKSHTIKQKRGEALEINLQDTKSKFFGLFTDFKNDKKGYITMKCNKTNDITHRGCLSTVMAYYNSEGRYEFRVSADEHSCHMNITSYQILSTTSDCSNLASLALSLLIRDTKEIVISKLDDINKVIGSIDSSY
jgi:hypothetical protein